MSKNIPLQNLPFYLLGLFKQAVDTSLKRIGLRGVRELSRLFKTEGKSLDVTWDPLQQAYLAQKIRSGKSDKILHRTTTLAQSFGYTAGAGEVEIGTTTTPYAIFHEYGTKQGIPPRPFIYPVGKYFIKEGIPGDEFMKALQGA